MNTFEAPNGEIINIPEGRIITFDLTDEQNKTIRRYLPTKEYELYIAEDVTEIVAIPSTAQIILASAMSADELELLTGFYDEIIDNMYETVLWLGEPKPPGKLRCKIISYENFEELETKLKYHLLQSHKKSKATKEFSRKKADALMILSLIRSNPGSIRLPTALSSIFLR